MSGLEKVRILRHYPRGGRVWKPGDVCDVPVHALPHVLDSDPPFGELVGARVRGGSGVGDFDATESAMDTARKLRFDLAPFAGRGTGPGGRIYVSDVKRWAGVA